MDKFVWLTLILICFVCCIQAKEVQRRHRRWANLFYCHQQASICEQIRQGINPHFDDVINTTVVPIISESKLDSICSIHQQADTCYQRALHDSTCYYYYHFLFDKVTYTEYNDTYSFLCSTKQEYLQNTGCYGNSSVIAAEGQCSDVYVQQMQNLSQQIRDPYYLKEKLCLHIDEYLDCVETSLSAICVNSTAGLWLRVLLTKNLEPTYKSIGCELDTSGYLHYHPDAQQGSSQSPVTESPSSGRSVNSGAIVGICITVVLLIISLILIIYFKSQQRKKQQQQVRAQQGTNQLPNYYSNLRAPPTCLYMPGAVGGGEEVKINPFGQSEVTDQSFREKEREYPPPLYSQDATALPAGSDDRNSMFSPPPPYVPAEEMDDVGDAGGYSNPVYGVEGSIANVD